MADMKAEVNVHKLSDTKPKLKMMNWRINWLTG